MSEILHEGDWIECRESLPPSEVVVETKIDDELGPRNVCTLFRVNRLWLVPDGGMHMFYAPTHWRPVPKGGG